MPLRKRIAFDCADGYGEFLGGSETVGPYWSVKNGDNEMRISRFRLMVVVRVIWQKCVVPTAICTPITHRGQESLTFPQ